MPNVDQFRPVLGRPVVDLIGVVQVRLLDEPGRRLLYSLLTGLDGRIACALASARNARAVCATDG